MSQPELIPTSLKSVGVPRQVDSHIRQSSERSGAQPQPLEQESDFNVERLARGIADYAGDHLIPVLEEFRDFLLGLGKPSL